MMIAFHVFNTSNSQQAWLSVCRLVEEHYLAQRQIYLVMDDREQAERFDKLLWTYRDDSFIPHHIYDEKQNDSSPVIIGYDQALPLTKDLMINLSQHVPTQYHHFQHLIEIVINDAQKQQRARERYKFYRDQQHQIETIKQ